MSELSYEEYKRRVEEVEAALAHLPYIDFEKVTDRLIYIWVDG
jgi:hypothetical protein